MTPLDDLQKIGDIEIEGYEAEVVLCRDEGSDIAILNIYFNGFSRIVTASYSEPTADEIHLSLIKVEQVDDLGQITEINLKTPHLHHWEGTTAELHRTESGWSGKWKNYSPKSGKINLRPAAKINSRRVEKVHTCRDWSDFKTWATSIRSEYELFRGQGCNSFSLQTSFHRTGRTRLDKFSESLSEFHTHAEAATPMGLDPSKRTDLPKILALAQHHGLPTPLLDWTRSPYIAGFFAMADAWENRTYRDASTHARVYACSKKFVKRASPSILILRHPEAFAHFLSVTPSGNARLYAQQGSFLVTNLANVEGYIRRMEIRERASYLCAADVPVSSAMEALEDLSYMGITAATMFPGLDGVARMLKHRLGFSK